MIAATSRSLGRRLLGNNLSIIGLAMVSALLITGVFAPFLAPYDPHEMMFEYVYQGPSSQFWMGTDALGRDLLSRIIWGARTSLLVGLGATLVALLVGVTFGGLAGFYGKAISQIFMRLADIQLSIPSLILLIVTAAVLGERSMLVIVGIIGVTMWPTIGRITRSKVLDLKTRDYVEAARMSGASNSRVLWRHIMPNALGPITVIATLDIGSAVIMESSLSFLGLGDPRMVSWGNMLSTGLQDMVPAPWIAVFPGCAIFFTVWGLNMFGDALRDALDVET